MHPIKKNLKYLLNKIKKTQLHLPHRTRLNLYVRQPNESAGVLAA
jgi:hypothetical protein